MQRGPSGGDIIVHQCRRCRRYEHTDTYYCHHEPESASLLSLCLKNIPALQNQNHLRGNGLSSIHLIDSMWIWTEPHCMRLKVRLTIRADVGESPRCVTIQQRIPVELFVKFNQCPECNREFTNRTWQAVVQIRQKRPTSDGPRKGLIILEQSIAKNDTIRKHVLSMEVTRNGFDFYFLDLMHAQSFSSFLSRIAPMKVKSTQKLVSEDVKNNKAHVKHTIVCDMVSLCRDDLVICDKSAAKDGCGAGRLTGRLCIVNRMSSVVQLVDAAPTRNNIQESFADLPASNYWKGEKYYRVVFSSHRLVRFIVLDVELYDESPNHGYTDEGDDKTLYSGPKSGFSKYAIADCIVARECDFGTNDETFQCTTHLGNLITSGDIVLGYDLVSSVLPGADEWSIKNSFNSTFELPDVVLVKKVNDTSLHSNNDEEGEETLDDSENKKEKSKSKKRERRQRRREKKDKDFEAAASRMGFKDGKEGEDPNEQLWEQERKAFEAEVEKDAELESDLHSIAQKELELSHGMTHHNNDEILEEELEIAEKELASG